MTRPSKTLIGTITEKAMAAFPKTLTKDNMAEVWPEWVNFWYATAEAFYNDCQAEGLTDTCTKIREIIDEQKRLGRYFNEEVA